MPWRRSIVSQTLATRGDVRQAASVVRPRPVVRSPRALRPGKYGHGLALAPDAEALSEALVRLRSDEALTLLVRLHSQRRGLDEIESTVLEPAIRKVGELWLRGRLDSSRFDLIGAVAIEVERHFHQVLATAEIARQGAA